VIVTGPMDDFEPALTRWEAVSAFQWGGSSAPVFIGRNDQIQLFEIGGLWLTRQAQAN